jgi:hypothetical protein
MSIVEFLMVLRAKRRLKGAFLVRLSGRPFLNSFLRAPSDSLMYAEVAIAPPRVLSAGYPGPIPFLRGVMNLPLKNFPSSTACGCNQSLSSTSAFQNSLFSPPFSATANSFKNMSGTQDFFSALASELVDPMSISSFFERVTERLQREFFESFFSKSLFLPEFELLEDQ